MLAAVEGTDDARRARRSTTSSSASRVLFWGLERPQDARALLDGARATGGPARLASAAASRCELQLAALQRGLRRARVEASEQLLADPALEPRRARLAEQRRRTSRTVLQRPRARGARAARCERAAADPDPRPGRRARADGCARRSASRRARTGRGARLDAGMMREAVRANDHEAAGQRRHARLPATSSPGRYRGRRALVAEAELHFERQDASGRSSHARAVLGRASATARRRRRAPPRCWSGCARALGATAPALDRSTARSRAREGWAALRQGDRDAARAAVLGSVAERRRHAASLRAARLRGAARGRAGPRARPPLAAARARAATRGWWPPTPPTPPRSRRGRRRAAGVRGGVRRASARDRYAMEAAADAADAFVAAGRQDSARRAAARSPRAPRPGHQGGAPPDIAASTPPTCCSRRARASSWRSPRAA